MPGFQYSDDDPIGLALAVIQLYECEIRTAIREKTIPAGFCQGRIFKGAREQIQRALEAAKSDGKSYSDSPSYSDSMPPKYRSETPRSRAEIETEIEALKSTANDYDTAAQTNDTCVAAGAHDALRWALGLAENPISDSFVAPRGPRAAR